MDMAWRGLLDDLVEKSSQGSFTQQGRDDILATTIGRPKKPGYVLRNEFKKELFPELRDELLSEIKSEIASLGLAIQGPPKGAPPIVASTKGSCPLPEELGDGVDVPIDCELYVDVPIDCELYVDDPLGHLVALGLVSIVSGPVSLIRPNVMAIPLGTSHPKKYQLNTKTKKEKLNKDF
ncbi:hypothetical protein LR48_Vigan08g058100 [Vigna angularis]|uniref:Uncharacterized protein n=1 Tax=Phaseolus angularis TaxID=3914 RepID=A0A0L9V4X0_PHAAN|nr:hypothetical protein LR48_Vigan08g058100 [Vigna angularis]